MSLLKEIFQLAEESSANFAEAKKCTKGVSCGFACIERKDDCLIELSENQAILGLKLAHLIQNQTQDINVKDKNRFFDNSIKEAEAIVARGDILSEDRINDLKLEVSKVGNFIELVKGLNEELTDDQIKVIAASTMNALPAKLQAKLGKSGLPGQAWIGRNEQNQDIFKPLSKTTALEKRIRGAEIIAQYIRQGGIDAYTLNPNPMSILDMDVEHVLPEKNGGSDSPDNWVLIRGGLNKKRSNTDLINFVKNAKSWLEMTPEQQQNEYNKSAKAKQSKSAIKKLEFIKNLAEDTERQSGIALEAQAVHQFGAKGFRRLGRDGTTVAQVSFLEIMTDKAISLRTTKYKDFKTNKSDNYSKDISDFKSYYKEKFPKLDKYVLEERVNQHASGLYDMKEIIRQDDITLLLNEEVFKPYADIRKTRAISVHVDKTKTDEEALEIEKAAFKQQLEKDGIDKNKIEEILNKLPKK